MELLFVSESHFFQNSFLSLRLFLKTCVLEAKALAKMREFTGLPLP